MKAAAAWESGGDQLPPEIMALLDSAGHTVLRGQCLLAAFPEWQVELPGGANTSSTDVLAVCRNDAGLCVIGVEAKVSEDFGPLLAEKRAGASPGQAQRIAYLEDLFGVARFDDGVRYQLVHRTASALLTARQFHAAAAVMVVHAFDTPIDQRRDFEVFTAALRAEQVAPLVFRVPALRAPDVYLAWCDGDPAFREVVLPSAL